MKELTLHEESRATTVYHDQIEALAEQLSALEEAYRRFLRDGIDYARLPGTPRPTLLQPGAEKLARVFGLAIEEELVRFDVQPDAVHAVVRVNVYRGGELLGSAHGAASSMESKYRWRWIDAEKPEDDAIARDLVARGEARWRKREGQWVFQRRVPNPDVHDLQNTILKMAAKRAFISAIKRFTAASSFFLVDIDDMEEEVVRGEAQAPPKQSKPRQSTRSLKSRLIELMKANGLNTTDEQQAWISFTLGREVTKEDPLTTDEIKQLIEILEQ